MSTKPISFATFMVSVDLILFFAICSCGIRCVTPKKTATSSSVLVSPTASVLPTLLPMQSSPFTFLVECGDTQKMVDECFKDLPPHLMEFLQNSKIVVNDDEIASKCIVFKRGMSCFDNYTASCLSNDNFAVFKNNVAGARTFLTKFCDDRKFQEDYLKHKECFAHIQLDWKKCTNDFQRILSEELHSGDGKNMNSNNITRKFMEFCCTRHAYENCIYNSARYKCYKHSAIFARETAKILSEEKHFTNCRQYENILCAASGSRPRQQQPVAVLLLLPIVMMVFDFQ